MQHMRFSIVIPTLNEEKYIGGLLESISNQTFQNFEVIVVDSPKTTDSTKSIAESFRSKIKDLHIISSPEGGISFQRNYGAHKAEHNYVLFLDADTLIEPVFLEKINVFLENNEVDIITCWNIPITKKRGDKMIMWLFNRIYMEGSKRISPVAVGTFIGVNRSAFIEAGSFSTEVTLAEDFELVLRMHKKGYKYALLRDPVIYFSVRRIDGKGRIPYAITAVKAGIHYYFKGPIKDPKLFDYNIEEEAIR